MVQAARSGKQNIIEGSEDGKTSTEMELKLLTRKLALWDRQPCVAMTRGCRFGGEVPRRTALEAADDSGRPVALGWYCGGVVVLGAAWLVYDAFFCTIRLHISKNLANFVAVK